MIPWNRLEEYEPDDGGDYRVKEMTVPNGSFTFLFNATDWATVQRFRFLENTRYTELICLPEAIWQQHCSLHVGQECFIRDAKGNFYNGLLVELQSHLAIRPHRYVVDRKENPLRNLVPHGRGMVGDTIVQVNMFILSDFHIINEADPKWFKQTVQYAASIEDTENVRIQGKEQSERKR